MEADMVLPGRYAQMRDAEAFAALVRRHAGMVFAVARRVNHRCFVEQTRPRCRRPRLSRTDARHRHQAASVRNGCGGSYRGGGSRVAENGPCGQYTPSQQRSDHGRHPRV